MKKIFLAITFFILILSCGSTTSNNNIIGKWVLKDIDFKIPGVVEKDDSRRFFVDVTKKMFLDKLFFKIRSNNTIDVIIPAIGSLDTEIKKGKWDISNDNKVLNIAIDDEQKYHIEILESTSKKLVLLAPDSLILDVAGNESSILF